MQVNIHIIVNYIDQVAIDGFTEATRYFRFQCTSSHYRKGLQIPRHPELGESGVEIHISREARTPGNAYHLKQLVLALANLAFDNPKIEILD